MGDVGCIWDGEERVVTEDYVLREEERVKVGNRGKLKGERDVREVKVGVDFRGGRLRC